MGLSKFRLYKYCKTVKGWRYCRAVIAVDGKIRSNAVLVDGKEEVHEEGRNFFNINGQWVPAGDTSTKAYRAQTKRLAKQRYKRDTGEEFPEPHVLRSLRRSESLLRMPSEATLPNWRFRSQRGRGDLGPWRRHVKR
jgi:hypothetical protein